MAMTTVGIFVALLWLLVELAVLGAVVYLFILIVKALKKYIGSKEVREEKKVMRRSLGEVLRAERTRSGRPCGADGRHRAGREQMGKRRR